MPLAGPTPRLRSRAASEGTAQRLLDVVAALHALLVAHLPAFPSTPLLVHVALTSGKLAPALLQLLAHRSMRDLAQHAALTEHVLGLVAVLASPDLQPLLLQASRFSNEHLSLAQVGPSRGWVGALPSSAPLCWCGCRTVHLAAGATALIVCCPATPPARSMASRNCASPSAH
jgi:hypothetical protein